MSKPEVSITSSNRYQLTLNETIKFYDDGGKGGDRTGGSMAGQTGNYSNSQTNVSLKFIAPDNCLITIRGEVLGIEQDAYLRWGDELLCIDVTTGVGLFSSTLAGKAANGGSTTGRSSSYDVGTITSYGNEVKFVFSSDSMWTAGGWDFEVTAIQKSPISPVNNGVTFHQLSTGGGEYGLGLEETIKFYDNGGKGGDPGGTGTHINNYPNGQNVSLKFKAPENCLITISGEVLGIEYPFDILTLYDLTTRYSLFSSHTHGDSHGDSYGDSHSYDIPTITSHGNEVIFVFRSDGTERAGGWEFEVTAIQIPIILAINDVLSLSDSQSVGCQGEHVLVRNEKITFHDSGGQGGDYHNGQNVSLKFKAPENCLITISGEVLGIEHPNDYLTLRDLTTGISLFSSIREGNNSSYVIQTITSHSNEVLFAFKSGGGTVAGGWDFEVTAIERSPIDHVINGVLSLQLSTDGHEYGLKQGETIRLYDSGGEGGDRQVVSVNPHTNNYNNKQVVSLKFKAPENCLITISGEVLGIQYMHDYLTIYDLTADHTLFSSETHGDSHSYNIQTITSHGNEVLFAFDSDRLDNAGGWDFEVTAINAEPDPEPNTNNAGLDMTSYYFANDKMNCTIADYTTLPTYIQSDTNKWNRTPTQLQITTEGLYGDFGPQPATAAPEGAVELTTNVSGMKSYLNGCTISYNENTDGYWSFAVDSTAVTAVCTVGTTCDLSNAKWDPVIGDTGIYDEGYFVDSWSDYVTTAKAAMEADAIGVGNLAGHNMIAATAADAGAVPSSFKPSDTFVINLLSRAKIQGQLAIAFDDQDASFNTVVATIGDKLTSTSNGSALLDINFYGTLTGGWKATAALTPSLPASDHTSLAMLNITL